MAAGAAEGAGAATVGGARSAELPAAFVALEAATREALAAASGADAWDGRTRTAVLAWLTKHTDRVALLQGRVLAAEREAGTWGLAGDRDLAGFVGRTSRQGRGAGLAAVGQAETLASMPTVARALDDGPVTSTHVQQLSRATATSPELATRLATPDGQAQVVELARRLDGQEFGKHLRRMSASLDPAARQREHDEQRARRFLTLSHTPGGTLLRGALDAVAGHKLAKAIDALNPRPAADDERTREQRQADALVTMVERTLTDKATTPGAVAPVQAVVTFDQQTWAALRAAEPDGQEDTSAPQRTVGHTADGHGGAAAPRSTPTEIQEDLAVPLNASPAPGAGAAADVARRLVGAPPVVDETGRPWPADEIARALCDCALTRVVLDAAGQPLDLGHRDRLFNRAQWIALYASGQTTCAVDGCGMPLRYTELHHIAWWKRDGGPTDLTNCAPECFFHHQDIHRNDIRVTRRPDGSYEHRWPDGRPYGGAPRRERPPTAPMGEPPTAESPTAESRTCESSTPRPPASPPLDPLRDPPGDPRQPRVPQRSPAGHPPARLAARSPAARAPWAPDRTRPVGAPGEVGRVAEQRVTAQPVLDLSG